MFNAGCSVYFFLCIFFLTAAAAAAATAALRSVRVCVCACGCLHHCAAAAVLLLSAPTERLLQRLKGRITDPKTGIIYGPHRPPPASLLGGPQGGPPGAHREDDAIDVLQKRIKTYEEGLAPILNALRGEGPQGAPRGPPPQIVEIDASRHVDDVTRDALAAVKPLLTSL